MTGHDRQFTQAGSRNDDHKGLLIGVLIAMLGSFLLLTIAAIFVGWRVYQRSEIAGQTPQTVFASANSAADKNGSPDQPPFPDDEDNDAGRHIGHAPDADVAASGLASAESSETTRSTRLADNRPTTPDQAKPSWPLYQFKSDQNLTYQFDIEAEVADEKIQFAGRNLITPIGEIAEIENDVPPGERTGTGFVIHSSGLVVTCAHVVQDASQIKATLGDRVYDASVIKIDPGKDLALLKVNAKRLPSLKLADSDQARLGQAVRAIGYPLSDILGKSIKVIRGEISGKSRQDGVGALQLDAAVNPGNSGGPVVDDRGRVVGVVSRGLSGIGLAPVAFAVPSNDVIQLAESAGVQVDTDDDGSPTSVAQLIDNVSASTVLLEVTDGVQAGQSHQLQLFCHLRQIRSTSDRSFASPLPQTRHVNGTIKVNSLGQVLGEDLSDGVPFLMEGAYRIGIEMLPKQGSKRAERSRVVLFEMPESRDQGPGYQRFGFGMPRNSPWQRPQRRQRESSVLTGVETVSVVLGDQNEEGVEVIKNYSSDLSDDSRGKVSLKISGTGRGRFDTVGGFMVRMKQNLTMTLEQTNVSLRIPIKLSYHLLDEDRLEKEKQARRKRGSNQASRPTAAAQVASPESRVTIPKSTTPNNRNSFPTDKQPGKTVSIKDAPQTNNLGKFDFEK